ncbi:MAG TPA: hypothetical protein PLC53_02925 [Bacilli bacterium]|nr:hypothetical protein [Bacilli bacterium]
MKAATGELNLTLITIIALGAVLGFFWLLWPSIKEKITDTWDDQTSQTGYVEVVDTNLI